MLLSIAHVAYHVGRPLAGSRSACDHWHGCSYLRIRLAEVSPFLEAGNQARCLPLICKSIQPQTTVKPRETQGVGSSLIAKAGLLTACLWGGWITWRGCCIQFDLGRSEMAGANFGVMQSAEPHLDVETFMLRLAVSSCLQHLASAASKA